MGIQAPDRDSQITSKSITFTGAAGLGAIGAVPLFTVTGTILIEKISAVSVLTPVGATGTIALGVTGNTALMIAATVGTTLTTGLLWTGAAATGGVAYPAACKDVLVNANVISTVAVAALTGGTLRYDVVWRPLSADGNLQ